MNEHQSFAMFLGVLWVGFALLFGLHEVATAIREWGKQVDRSHE